VTSSPTPEQEDHVRRALAAAARAEDGGAPPTMPTAVRARLDGVLAELTAGRSRATAAPDEEDRLAAQRRLRDDRRRRRRGLLVAAAAVVVVAAAGGAVVSGLGTGGGSEDSAASSTSAGAGSAAVDLPVLRSASLPADVRRVARTLEAGRAEEGGNGAKDLAAVPPTRADGTPCVRPDRPPGARVVAVLLDGRPATLVLDRARGGTREAAVYSCDDGSSPVRTTRLPVR
jgi:hypothetical protein